MQSPTIFLTHTMVTDSKIKKKIQKFQHMKVIHQ